MKNDHAPQSEDARRRCSTYGQLKHLSEFGLKNGRPRRVCWTCRAVRGFVRKEKEHKQGVADLIHQLAHLSRRERLTYRKAESIIEELIALCGGMEAAADAWWLHQQEALRDRPNRRATMDQLYLVGEFLSLCRKQELAESLEARRSAVRRRRPARAARAKPDDHRADDDIDFSRFSTPELQAMVERYRQQKAAERNQGQSGARGEGER
ncbi:MAG: hypothetical protein HQ582_32020 [Planctomycetes bacterium]|nr:hypothetical protein [Planctomycetota bacterium]